MILADFPNTNDEVAPDFPGGWRLRKAPLPLPNAGVADAPAATAPKPWPPLGREALFVEANMEGGATMTNTKPHH